MGFPARERPRRSSAKSKDGWVATGSPASTCPRASHHDKNATVPCHLSAGQRGGSAGLSPRRPPTSCTGAAPLTGSADHLGSSSGGWPSWTRGVHLLGGREPLFRPRDLRRANAARAADWLSDRFKQEGAWCLRPSQPLQVGRGARVHPLRLLAGTGRQERASTVTLSSPVTETAPLVRVTRI